MENKLECKTTRWGFRDITSALEKDTLKIEKDDIIKNVLIKRIEKAKQTYGERAGQEFYIGHFSMDSINLRGRIFPLDELIDVGKRYDLITQSIKSDNFIDTQVYHDLNCGEKIRVQISGYGKETHEPSFKIFKYITGFIKDQSCHMERDIEIGDCLSIEILSSFRSNSRINVWAKALNHLE